ncbi:TPA: type 4 pilus major pilin [Stenotrophomonas maltophilia]
MKNKHKRRANGFGLVETLLTLGALSALSLGIYLVLSPASAAAQAKREQDNLRDLSTAVDRSFGLLGSFQGVSAVRVVADNLAPTRMVDGSTLRTAWGTSVTVAPHTVNAPGDGFVVVYPFAPADVCPRLAAAVARDVFDIRVEGVSVFDAGQLNPSAAAAACGQADTATMEFVYHSGLVAGAAVATPPLQLPPAPPSVSTPTSSPVGGPVGPASPVGPAGPLGPVTSAPPVTPPPPPPSVPPPSTPVTPTTPPSAPPPSAPPPPTTVPACVVPSPESRSLATCPAGTWGVSRQTRQWWCGDVGGVYEAWATAQPGAWTTTGNTCAACPGSTTEPQTRWETTSSACPSGQVGLITWDYEQARSRLVSYNCPAGTASLPGPTYGAWSSWSNTGQTRSRVSTCAPACSAPAASSVAISRSLPNQSQTVACPSGQSGTRTQTRTVTEGGTRTTTWTCPGPTSSASDVWSGSYSYGAWTTTSSNCVTPPADWSALRVTCEAKAFGGTYSDSKDRPFTAGATLRCEADCKTSGSSVNTCRDFSNTNAVFRWEVLASTDYQVSWAGDCAGTTGNRCSISLSGRRGSRSGTFTVVHVPTGEQRSMNFSGSYEAQEK